MPHSSISAWVIPTDEEQAIGRTSEQWVPEMSEQARCWTASVIVAGGHS
jgi:hypothetical protein